MVFTVPVAAPTDLLKPAATALPPLAPAPAVKVNPPRPANALPILAGRPRTAANRGCVLPVTKSSAALSALLAGTGGTILSESLLEGLGLLGKLAGRFVRRGGGH